MIPWRYMAYAGISAQDSILRARRVGESKLLRARREWYWERLPVKLRSDWRGMGF